MDILTLVLCSSLLPQTQGGISNPAPNQAIRSIGVIQTIDLESRRITITTDARTGMIISFDPATRFLQVAPGAKDLSNAAMISPSSLAPGDRILARGSGGTDPLSLAATSIIVMSKADLARRHAAEQAEWERRGIGGVITGLDAASREVTIKRSAADGAKPVVIVLSQGALMRRYAVNSVKFSDARPSLFEELHVGDQVKALGTSNEDHSRFTAEELVSGSFRNIAGLVVSLDPGRNTIVITDLATNGRIQAQISSDTTVRRLTPEVSQMLATRIAGSASAAASAPQADGRQARPPGSVGSGRDSDQKQSSGDLQAAIDRLPHLKLADLKTGEAVVLTCTNSDDPARVTAITLLAGVELLLKSSPKGGNAFDLGSWNLDLNMGAGVP